MKVLQKVKRIFTRYSERNQFKNRLVLVSDGAGWIFDEVTMALGEHLPPEAYAFVSKSGEWKQARDSIIHFIERSWAWDDKVLDAAHASNKLIALWWHGKTDSKDPIIQGGLKRIQQKQDLFSLIQVPTSIARDTMIEIGVPRQKIVLLPEGLKCKDFKRDIDGQGKIQARQDWGIPQEAFVVGNFQKDGNGWGSGDEPKLIKGPDTLADMLIELHQQRPVFAFIPGPARGYVVQRLTEAGVPFANPGFVTDGEKFKASYHALDVYVSPSRDEGGPAGIMEAMASGIPVVSTRSGMPVDYIEQGVNGFLADVEDYKGLADFCMRLLDDKKLAKELSVRGYETIQNYDWSVLAPQYYELLYRRLGSQ